MSLGSWRGFRPRQRFNRPLPLAQPWKERKQKYSPENPLENPLATHASLN